MEQHRVDERLESLQTVYNYLETRYQEQIDLLKQVDIAIKSRLAVLSAVMGIVTIIMVGVWKLPAFTGNFMPQIFLIISIIPGLWALMQVYFIAMQVLEKKLSTPGFAVNDFMQITQHENPSLESIYEDFVKSLTAAIGTNEIIFHERSRMENGFRTWNKRVLYFVFLPLVTVLVLYIFMIIIPA